jgi:hypothetical protein
MVSVKASGKRANTTTAKEPKANPLDHALRVILVCGQVAQGAAEQRSTQPALCGT